MARTVELTPGKGLQPGCSVGRAARAAQGCSLLLPCDRDTSPVCNVGTLTDEGDHGWGSRFEAAWVQGGMGWGQEAVHWGYMWKQKMGERGMGGP